MNQKANLKVDSIRDRALGCLLGQAVGDAVGTRYEFLSSKDSLRLMQKDLDHNGHLPLLGDGPFNVSKGQITDDTELALTLARCLVQCQCFDISQIANSYANWFHSRPFDIGNTTKRALQQTKPNAQSIDNLHKMRRNTKEYNANSLSNGCLMRISPLAIAGIHWSEDQLRRAASADCQLTHAHLVATEAVQMYVMALQTAILTGDVSQVYHKAISVVAPNGVIHQILLAAQTHAEPIMMINKTKCMTDSHQQGYLGVALQNCFYELLHTSNFNKQSAM